MKNRRMEEEGQGDTCLADPSEKTACLATRKPSEEVTLKLPSALLASRPDLTGRVLRDRFRIGACLGSGGQSDVYECQRVLSAGTETMALSVRSGEEAAYSPRAERTPPLSAIKVTLLGASSSEQRQILLTEYRIQSRIIGPRFLRTYECFEEKGVLCFTMDLMRGGSLKAFQARPLPAEIAVGFALQLFEGLSILHARGVVHRDIKPANLLLAEPFDCTQAAGTLPGLRIADFGIADVQDMVFGDRGFARLRGTLYFMAPELGGCDTVDARVDIYAAGVTLFYLLTGRHPLSGSLSGTRTEIAVEAQLFGQSPRLPDVRSLAPEVPSAIAEVVSSLIHPDPSQRPRTAALAFDRLHGWFRSANHGWKLPQLPSVEYDPYLSATTFCGRDRELETAQSFLRNYLAPALNANASSQKDMRLSLDQRRELLPPSILRIVGEAGMGKSRLTRQIMRKAQEDFRIIYIQTARETGAYQKVLEFFQECEKYFEEKRDSAKKEDGSLLSRLQNPKDAFYVPDIALGTDPRFSLLHTQRARGEDARAYHELREQYRLERLAAVLRLRSYEKPLCIVIEDAQWLDRPSMRLLGHAMRFLAASRNEGFFPKTVFIFNHRPKEEDGQLDHVLSEIKSVGRIERDAIVIELSPFGVESAATVIESMLELPAKDEQAKRFAQALHKQNRSLAPLSVEQCLWSLFSEGSLVAHGADGRWNGRWNLDPELITDAGAPINTREAIGMRAARFDTKTLRILGVAAVVGRMFDIELVARTMKLSGQEVLSAMDLAGRAGFVREIEGTGQEHIADAATPAVSYSFTHDRYREAILANLPADVRRKTHSAIARAIRARWGEVHDIFESLAEHYFAAEEYSEAQHYGTLIAEYAFAASEHERAARCYEIVIESARRNGATVSLKTLDCCAASYEAIGHFDDANQKLKAMLRQRLLTKEQALSVTLRMAESHYRSQDYKNALPPLLDVLASQGVYLPEANLAGVLRQVPGLALLLTAPLVPRLIHMSAAPSPAQEMILQQALWMAIECGMFVKYDISLRAMPLLVERLTRQGLHPMSPVLFGALGVFTASQGLYWHSRRYEEIAERSMSSSQEYGARTEPSTRENANFTNHYFLLRLIGKIYRGEFGPQHQEELAAFYATALRLAERCVDLQRRWLLIAFAAVACHMAGRRSCFIALWQSLLEFSHKYGMERNVQMYTPALQAVLHELQGAFSRAAAAWRQMEEATERFGNKVDQLCSAQSRALCISLSELPAEDAVLDELKASMAVWWSSHFMHPGNFGPATGLAAMCLLYFRRNQPADEELLRHMRLGRRQCLAARQTTAIFLAAEATFEMLAGKHLAALRKLEEATSAACTNGFIGTPLQTVLRIAVRILPEGTPAQRYYANWERNLTHNICSQEPLDVADIHDGKLSRAPAIGQP